MVVTRQAGATLVSERGLITANIDQQVFVDCSSFHHGIPLHVNGQLSPYFLRFNTWDCNGFHVKISQCVEPRFPNCRFGRNGGGDRTSQGYVQIDGAGRIQVDTVDFLGCQFNQSGAVAGVVLSVINYNNPNGIFNFVDCHAENWASYFLLIDASTSRLHRINITACTITSAAVQLIAGNVVGVVEDLQINGSQSQQLSVLIDSHRQVLLAGPLRGTLL
jgi:hypothetical protein